MEDIKKEILQGLLSIKKNILSSGKSENISYREVLKNVEPEHEKLSKNVILFLERLPKDYIKPSVSILYDHISILFSGFLSYVILNVDNNSTRAIFASNDNLNKTVNVYKNYYLTDDIYFNVIIKKIYSFIYDNVPHTFVFSQDVISKVKNFNNKIYSVKIVGSGDNLLTRMSFIIFVNEGIKDIIYAYEDNFEPVSDKILDILLSY
ncbi:MAG: hypothetical protein QXF12_00220 [Candidatus Aenigmatarchaeota archaeon]